MEVAQRLRGDPGDSYVRISELVNIGLIRFVGNTVQPYATQGATSAPVTSARNIFTPYTVQGGGNLTSDITLQLVGDILSPGPNQLYGTSGAGSKGWQSLPDFTRGATWVASSGAVTTPTNDVYVQIPRACTLKEVTIMTSGGPGNCTVDIRKGTFASFPPVTSICGGTPPAIAAGTTYDNTTLSGWTVSFAANDVLAFHITGVVSFTQVAISLRMG